MLTKERLKIKKRIRAKVKGTTKRPRLSVFKSANYIYAQLIDDNTGNVLAASSDKLIKAKGTKKEKARKVGVELAKLATDKKIKAVVFDRGGFKYHGRVKELAEGAREGGLEF